MIDETNVVFRSESAIRISISLLVKEIQLSEPTREETGTISDSNYDIVI